MSDRREDNLGKRARTLLAMIRDPKSEVYEFAFALDGEWMKLNFLSNMGPKTCAQLVRAGILECDSSGYWYRLVTPDEDFGDLWVA